MKTSRKRIADIVVGLLVAAGGVLGYLASANIRDVAGSVSASTVPRLTSVILALLGALLIVSAATGGGKKDEKSGGADAESKPLPPFGGVLSALELLIIFVLYAVLLKPAGFIVCTVLFLLSLMLLLAPSDARRPVKFLVISVCAAAGIYGIFVIGFKVMLPAGVLDLSML